MIEVYKWSFAYETVGKEENTANVEHTYSKITI